MADDDTLGPAARFLDLDADIAQIVRAVEQARARWPVVDVRQYALIDTLRWLAECLEEGMSLRPPAPTILDGFARDREERLSPRDDDGPDKTH